VTRPTTNCTMEFGGPFTGEAATETITTKLLYDGKEHLLK